MGMNKEKGWRKSDDLKRQRERVLEKERARAIAREREREREITEKERGDML